MGSCVASWYVGIAFKPVHDSAHNDALDPAVSVRLFLVPIQDSYFLI